MNQYKQHHMSKKELKANKMVEAAVNFRHFLVNNKKKVYQGLLVIVLLIALLIGKFAYDSSQNEKASEKLNQTLLLLQSTKDSANINLVQKNLSSIIRDFSGTIYAGRAAFHLGRIQYNVQGYLKAIQSFKAAADDGTGYIVPSAQIAIGDCYNQLNNPKKALDYYNKVIENNYSGFTGSAQAKKVHTLIALNRFKEASAVVDALEKSRETAFVRVVPKLRALVKYYGKQTGSLNK